MFGHEGRRRRALGSAARVTAEADEVGFQPSRGQRSRKDMNRPESRAPSQTVNAILRFELCVNPPTASCALPVDGSVGETSRFAQ